MGDLIIIIYIIDLVNTYYTCHRVCESPVIYNYTSANEAPVTNGQISRIALPHLRQSPLEGVLWYPEVFLTHSPAVHRLEYFIFMFHGH